MFYRLPLFLARRVAIPSAVARPLLARPFSLTPSAFSPTAAKAQAKAPKTKTKAKSTTATKAKTKAKAKSGTTKTKAKTSGRKKPAKKVVKPTFTKEQLKVPLMRGPSAYLLYTLEESRKLPKATGIPERVLQVKNLAAQWKALSAAEQQVYNDKAAEGLKQTRAEFIAWREQLAPSVLRAINKKRVAAGKPRIRVPHQGPKRPQSAFFRFLNEFRAQNPGLPPTEMSKRGGSAWRSLPAAKREVYVAAYHNAKKEQEARA